MDLLLILLLNSQKNLHPHRPCQILPPTTPDPMMKAICQVWPPTTSAPMTNAIKMKRVTTLCFSRRLRNQKPRWFGDKLERCHERSIDNLPLDKKAAQIVQQGHPLAKKLPLWLNLRPSAYQPLIYHGVFTSFQPHGPVSVEALDKAKDVIFDIKLLKVTRQNNNHVVKENKNGCIMDKV